jgi:hypothetical protein
MMKATKDREHNDSGHVSIDLAGRWDRKPLTDPSVRTTAIEIAGPEFSKNVLQVPLSEKEPRMFWIVRSETGIPGFRSSPRIRSAPQSRLLAAT